MPPSVISPLAQGRPPGAMLGIAAGQTARRVAGGLRGGGGMQAGQYGQPTNVNYLLNLIRGNPAVMPGLSNTMGYLNSLNPQVSLAGQQRDPYAISNLDRFVGPPPGRPRGDPVLGGGRPPISVPPNAPDFFNQMAQAFWWKPNIEGRPNPFAVPSSYEGARNAYRTPSGQIINREPGFFNPDNPWDTGRPEEKNRYEFGPWNPAFNMVSQGVPRYIRKAPPPLGY